ncbi:MAG: hypothetical protein ACM31D_03605 [Bacteroidota bacterium]
MRSNTLNTLGDNRRRATARRLLAQAESDPAAGAALDALPADTPCGAVLAERLRFGPPETWLGWRAGTGKVVVKLWPADQAPPPLPAIDHAGVAPLLDQGAGWRMFTWVAGETLSTTLRQGAVPAATVDQIADALAALHAAGVAHGDVTPANVVLGRTGAVLIDWGEDSAGTPGWRPAGRHDGLQRDHFGLRRLREVISAPPAGHTPAAGPRCPPDRE